MKVFLFGKDFKPKKEETFDKIELREKYRIEELIINNPCNSNEIYIIHNMKIINNDYRIHNELKKVIFFSSKDLKEKPYIREEKLNIYFNSKEKNKDIMELKELDLLTSKHDNVVEILKDDFVIILPGGSFGITFFKPLEEVNCIIKFEVHSIKDS